MPGLQTHPGVWGRSGLFCVPQDPTPPKSRSPGTRARCSNPHSPKPAGRSSRTPSPARSNQRMVANRGCPRTAGCEFEPRHVAASFQCKDSRASPALYRSTLAPSCSKSSRKPSVPLPLQFFHFQTRTPQRGKQNTEQDTKEVS